MPQVCIRFANEADTQTIVDFIYKLAEYEKLAHECVVDAATLKKNLFGPKPFAEVLLLEEDKTPVGFALFFHNFSTFLGKPGIYLEDLFVNPETRGKGYGKLLLKRLAEIAIERNCGRLEWWVLDWNTPAIKFYESLGAKPMTDWTVYRLTGDALTSLAMAKNGHL
jgi:GNAT superfamily N-acetyltransferase